MPTYRAYLIDADNRVSSYRPIEADNDAAALQAARQFADGCDVEVWDLDRMIGRLEGRRIARVPDDPDQPGAARRADLATDRSAPGVRGSSANSEE